MRYHKGETVLTRGKSVHSRSCLQTKYELREEMTTIRNYYGRSDLTAFYAIGNLAREKNGALRQSTLYIYKEVSR